MNNEDELYQFDGSTWEPLVRGMDMILKAVDPTYEVEQVTSKFGALRFYFFPTSDENEEYVPPVPVTDAMHELEWIVERLSQFVPLEWPGDPDD